MNDHLVVAHSCDFVRLHMILLLKQNVNFSVNIWSLIMSVVSVEMSEELRLV